MVFVGAATRVDPIGLDADKARDRQSAGRVASGGRDGCGDGGKSQHGKRQDNGTRGAAGHSSGSNIHAFATPTRRHGTRPNFYSKTSCWPETPARFVGTETIC
jgi:hypothetical protein